MMKAQRPGHERGAAVAAFTAGIVGSGPILLFINSMMIGPVTRDFHWGRGSYGFAVLLSTLANAAAVFFIGRAADRVGVRRILLPGIVLYALAMAAMSLGTPATFAIQFAVLGAFAASQGPQLYAKVISAWFVRRRALALALVAIGGGLGGAVWPQLVRVVTEHAGWRGAYVALGGAIFVLAFPVCALLLREPQLDAGSARERALAQNEHMGLSLREIVRTRSFWLITLAQTLGITVLTAILTSAVALLADRGFAPSFAGGFLATIGIAGIVGRVISGWLLDRFHTPRVALVFFAAPLLGLLLLSRGNAPEVLLAAACFGLALASENEIVGYFFSRYFGLRSYAGAYSIAFAIFAIGAGLGPFLIGRSFDANGNYHAALIALEFAVAVSTVLIGLLGTYTFGLHIASSPADRGTPAEAIPAST